MKNLFKIVAALFGVLVLLVVVAVVAVPMLFDPNDYRDDIVAKVKETTGRDLTIEGDIGVTVFPWIGAEVGTVELGNAVGFSDPYFARVERVNVRVKLLPLLSRELEADTVTIHGLALNLARDAEGKTNWGDLAAVGGEPGEKPASPGGGLAALAIGGLDVKNAKLRWTDARTGQSVAVERLDVDLGAIAPGTPVDLDLKAEVTGTELPVGKVVLALAGRLTADLAASAASVDGLELTAELSGGQVPGEKAEVALTGDLAADLASSAASVAGLDLKVELAGDQFPDGKAEIALTGSVDADLGTGAASVKDLVLTALDLEVKGALDVSPESVSGSLAVSEFDPKALLAALDQAAPETADENALTKLSLSTRVSGSPASVSLEPLDIVLDDTKLTGKLGLARFDAPLPAVAFDLTVDKLDADRYLPPPREGEQAPAATPGAAATQGAGLPLDTLRALDVDGSLKVGELKVAKVTTTEVLVTVKAKDGLIRLAPLGAKLYQGSYAGNIALDARSDQPKLSVDEKLAGVQAGPLLTDLTGSNRIDGTAELSAKLTAVGADAEAMKRSLNGTAAVAFTNGAVNGINLARTIREFKAKLKGQTLPPAKEALKTDFSEITGTFTASDGVITNQDLAAKSPLLRVTGKGEADLPGDAVDYRPTVTVVATTSGQGGQELEDLVGVPIPLKVTGPLASPDYGVDFDRAVEILARSQAQDLVKDRLDELGGGGAAGAAAGALGGLLGSGRQDAGEAADQPPAGDEGGSGGPARAVEDAVGGAVEGLKGLFGN